jgi:GR25 family glycosyltransferase involved in LPS biosynthesis
MNDIKIFYINLDKRKDRRKHMENILKGYDYERVSAIEDEDGYIGCAKSHILCLKMAKQRNLDKVIILEDDFMFYKNNNFDNIKLPEKYSYMSIIDPPKDKSGLSKQQLKLLKKDKSLFDKKIKIIKLEYDILLLCNLIKERKKINRMFSRVYQAEWTSGHLIKNTLYDDLIKNLQEGIELRLKNGKCRENNLDTYWNKLFKDYICICHNYTFATQKEGYSNIKKKNIQRVNH